jgi:hypothetical protein
MKTGGRLIKGFVPARRTTAGVPVMSVRIHIKRNRIGGKILAIT